MQEVMKDGSEGKTFVGNNVEELVPYIKKSLSDPKVKFVKVYRAKGPIKNEEIFMAEEEKVDTGKDLLKSLKEGEDDNSKL